MRRRLNFAQLLRQRLDVQPHRVERDGARVEALRDARRVRHAPRQPRVRRELGLVGAQGTAVEIERERLCTRRAVGRADGRERRLVALEPVEHRGDVFLARRVLGERQADLYREHPQVVRDARVDALELGGAVGVGDDALHRCEEASA